MDKIYKCREVSLIYLTVHYPRCVLIGIIQNGWTFLDSNLTVAQVIKKIAYDQYFIQVIQELIYLQMYLILLSKILLLALFLKKLKN